jgi:hypothetical protein
VRCAPRGSTDYAGIMSVVAPITASGSREPAKPRPIPLKVRRMVEIMVRGRPDDPDCVPLSFIEAAKIAGVAGDVARRWLDRGSVRALLRSERASFRAALCASNEAHLARLRSSSPNSMVRLHSIKALEQIEEQAESQHAGRAVPGLVVVVVGGGPGPSRQIGSTIEGESMPVDDVKD